WRAAPPSRPAMRTAPTPASAALQEAVPLEPADPWGGDTVAVSQPPQHMDQLGYSPEPASAPRLVPVPAAPAPPPAPPAGNPFEAGMGLTSGARALPGLRSLAFLETMDGPD